MNNCEIRQLAIDAARIRLGLMEGIYSAKSGHPGGSLSLAEVLAYLYGCEMNYRADEPSWDGRDRLVLSKGHAAPALYAALALHGFFPMEDMKTLRHTDSYLQGHPNMNLVPGVDMSTGSLGQGVSAAVGMAMAAKYTGKTCRVYSILGDGEIDEGQTWEAFMTAAARKLDNLCLMIDVNHLQLDGPTDEIMPNPNLEDKFRAFGFEVITVNGHDFEQLAAAFDLFHRTSGRPTCILLDTVKGKGVSYMENAVGWHGKAPNQAEYEQAMTELNAALTELEASK